MAECPAGFDWPTWISDLESVEDNALVRRTLTADERLRLLRIYNNEPPLTDHNPERIEIFSFPGNPLVAMVFVKYGCVTLTSPVPRLLLEDALGTKTNGGAP